jgi:hypothetical protein
LRCAREITACNGFALARDLLSGRRPVREHCAFCVEVLTADYFAALDQAVGKLVDTADEAVSVSTTEAVSDAMVASSAGRSGRDMMVASLKTGASSKRMST